PLVQRYPALPLEWLGNGPLVVLAEEHDRGVENRRPDKRLVHIPLAGRPVAQVDNGCLPGFAHESLARGTPPLAGRGAGLGADDDRVELEVVVCGVPAAVADAAVELQELGGVEAAAPGHAVLAIGGEGHVAGGQRPARADLCSLLAEQGGPDAEFPLPLQGDRLRVDPADDDQVAVEGLDLVGAQVKRVIRMICPFTLWGEELDEFCSRIGLPVQASRSRCGDRTVGVDGHVPLLALRAGPRITATGRSVLRSAAAEPRGRCHAPCTPRGSLNARSLPPIGWLGERALPTS